MVACEESQVCLQLAGLCCHIIIHLHIKPHDNMNPILNLQNNIYIYMSETVVVYLKNANKSEKIFKRPMYQIFEALQMKYIHTCSICLNDMPWAQCRYGSSHCGCLL